MITQEEYEEIKRRILDEIEFEKSKKEQQKKELRYKPYEYTEDEKKRIQQLIESTGYRDVNGYNAVCRRMHDSLLDACIIWTGAYRVKKDCQGFSNIIKDTTVPDRVGHVIQELMNRLIDVLEEEDWRTKAQ